MSAVKSNRCMYISTLKDFLGREDSAILGDIASAFHGTALTTSIEAWSGEISILKQSLYRWKEEDAATEIQVQGLELDYACILWDADFRYDKDSNSWGYYKFNGRTSWTIEKNEEAKKYMLNAYRVLLTRARQGIVICAPEGNHRLNAEGYPEDATRLPEFYDGTYEYLRSFGMQEL